MEQSEGAGAMGAGSDGHWLLVKETQRRAGSTRGLRLFPQVSQSTEGSGQWPQCRPAGFPQAHAVPAGQLPAGTRCARQRGGWGPAAAGGPQGPSPFSGQAGDPPRAVPQPWAPPEPQSIPVTLCWVPCPAPPLQPPAPVSGAPSQSAWAAL